MAVILGENTEGKGKTAEERMKTLGYQVVTALPVLRIYRKINPLNPSMVTQINFLYDPQNDRFVYGAQEIEANTGQPITDNVILSTEEKDVFQHVCAEQLTFTHMVMQLSGGKLAPEEKDASIALKLKDE